MKKLAKKVLSAILSVIMLTSVLTPAFSTSAATNKSFDEIVRTSWDVISTSEGWYGSINRDDNGAVSVGRLQWHATRALNLLKTVVNADKTAAKKILGDALYNEILTKTEWNTRILTESEAEKVSALLDTENGHKAEDDLAYQDVSSYINHGMGLGLLNPLTLVYYADTENQCGMGGAARIAKAAIVLAGKEEVTLDILHKAALEDSVAGRYSARRNKAYNLCMLLGWEDVGYDCEIWKTDSNLNIRKAPTTESELVASVPEGTRIIITSKVMSGDEYMWGHCYMGWICLTYASYEKGDIPYPYFFDVNGGTAVKPVGTAAVTCYNTARASNSIAVYDGDFSSSTAMTNAYGREFAVDKDGKVLSIPVYGACKTTIPKGGMVISAHGTMADWLYGKVKPDCYVTFDKDLMSISVYASYNDMLMAEKKTSYSEKFGELPIPTYEGHIFTGWFNDKECTGDPVTSESIFSSHEGKVLYAGWTEAKAANVLYVTDGGTLDGIITKKLTGINKTRLENDLIVYTEGDTTGTNIYGAEVSVDSTGKMTEYRGYGCGSMEIPDGGFVLSGHGAGMAFIDDNIFEGNYIFYSEVDSTVSVCETKDIYDSIYKVFKEGASIERLPSVTREHYRFLGWFTSSGEKATEATKIPLGGLVLYAKWELIPGKVTFNVNGGSSMSAPSTSVAFTGKNKQRTANTLIVYDKGSTTGTNPYGTEVIVSKTGTVSAIMNSGNNTVPAGGFVLSGHGTMASWLKENVKVGYSITLDAKTVYVYKCSNFSCIKDKTVKYESTYGALPTPVRDGFTFIGWFDKNGNKAEENAEVSLLGDITLTAKWSGSTSVTLSCSGATFPSGTSTAASGMNIHRAADTLVIYTATDTTGTNPYGTEAIVSQNGIVTEIRNAGNSKIPDGGFVLSGHGKMATWIKTNIKVGSYIIHNTLTVSVFRSKNHYTAKMTGKLSHIAGDTIGELPIPTAPSKSFIGWYYGDTKLSEDSLYPYDITAAAKWTLTETSAVFDTGDGSLSGDIANITASGTNIQRTADTLVIFNQSKGPATGTNNYGTEALVSKNGVVSAVITTQGNNIIPDGGFVLSGHGSKASWISANIRPGYYISTENNTVRVFANEADGLASLGKKTVKYGEPCGILPDALREGYILAGWTYDGVEGLVSENTVIPSCDDPVFHAVWENTVHVSFDLADGETKAPVTAALSGINRTRAANELIMYAGKNTTGTNPYGTEAVVSETGTVISVASVGNSAVPEGGIVISGHGTMSSWVKANIKVGDTLKVSGGTISIIPAGYSVIFSGKTIPAGQKIGYLPTPYMTGHDFVGWFSSDGKVDESSVISSDTVLTAQFKKSEKTVTFDTGDGSFVSASVAADGINTQRLSDQLIIQNIPDGEVERTFTNNEFGRIAVCLSDGTVESVAYGVTSVTLTEGRFALSGNGSKSTWINENLSVGKYVSVNGTDVKVFTDALKLKYSSGKKTVLFGDAAGELPSPVLYGFDFVRWEHSGEEFNEGTTVTENITVSAIYKEKTLTIAFDTAGGTIPTAPAVTSFTAKNKQRTAETLMVYDTAGKTTGTNIYGTEAVVDKGGKVIAVYGYGHGNNTVPDGGFVLSGHGSCSAWLSSNVKVGYYVELTNDTVKVWKSSANARITETGLTAPAFREIGELPVPEYEGHVFDGWYLYSDNTKLTESYIAKATLPVVVYASWK